MKKILTLLLGLLVTASISFAQDDEGDDKDSKNLVPNGSFEEWEGKLKKPGQIGLAAPWGSPTEEKADLFTENTTYEPVKVPKTYVGHQSGFEGVGYAGIRAYSYQNKEPRTYLTVKLKEELKKDQEYCISYYVSLGDLSKYAVNEISTYLSKLPVKSNKEANLKYEAQIPALNAGVQSDLAAWKGICDTYRAKGGERYITIGNFKENERTDYEKVKRPRGETRPQKFEAYYFIDKVALVPMSTGDRCACDAIDKTKSDYIFGTRITTNKSLAADVQLERSNVYYKRYQEKVDDSMVDFVTELVILMKNNPDLKIEMVGHIDGTENEKKKERPDLEELGKRRAAELKAHFEKEGVLGDRIIVSGMGADKPLSESRSEVGEAKNRRVEINLR